MTKHPFMASQSALQPLLELTRRVGKNPLLTQGSTGNCSAKADGVLWIKASGKWMADALQDDFLTTLDLADVRAFLRKGVDPADCYPRASLETAMHAALPHRVVMHVHCVNTIAWAVRSDASMQLQSRLEGLRWNWVPYIASGLPLASEIERTLRISPEANVFVLGNHGLVIGGEDAAAVETLLAEVGKRLAIPPRVAHPADYTALMELSNDSPWDLPDDDGIHVLGTDAMSRSILAGGLLYPCQAIFSGCGTPDLFRSVAELDAVGQDRSRYNHRPFLIVEGKGSLVNRSTTPAELAMLSGLAQVVLRLNSSTPLRYLTEAEVAALSGQVAYRYRELASAGH
jgi:rhamnose utilization protein RhaD (predicted bifunctional aldolase and dehydrogenase)